ncbi:hypothetical protein OROGR_002534 [Orobanche gracilis]
MEFTCLSEGNGFNFPPCHILDICGFRILFDCPMDLSPVTAFSPVPFYSNAIVSDGNLPCSCQNYAGSDLSEGKRSKIEKSLDENSLISGVPRYKTVKNLLLWDVSFIDVVLISSPMGMLGLPYLTRNRDFSAKVYATEAAARIGQLMMEDLVNMHTEFSQFYGPVEPVVPQWMKWDELELIPLELRQVICGADGTEFGAWMPLYRPCNLPHSDGNVTNATLFNDDEYLEEMEKLDFICSCSVDSIKAGGSILIPIGRLGIILQLLERFSLVLESEKIKVPIFFISSVAEELMAFTNIIPEWLGKQFQDRLYSGQPLFAHMEMLKDGRLHLFPAVHSLKLLEPCIVFCPHWTLRLGPVIHLLRRWCGDQNSLLVMEEGVDASLALLPFKPMAMKVLKCSFLSGMSLQKSLHLLQILQPRHVLFPEIFRQHIGPLKTPFSFGYYTENIMLHIPYKEEYSLFDIAIELTCRLQYTTLKQQDIDVARLKGEFMVEQGRYKLLMGDQTRMKPVLHFGRVDLNVLLIALRKMNMNITVEEVSGADGNRVSSRVHVTEPGEAVVEVMEAQTTIDTGDEYVASLIAQAVCSILDCV